MARKMSKVKWAIASLGFVGISSKKILNHLIANELEIAMQVLGILKKKIPIYITTFNWNLLNLT